MTAVAMLNSNRCRTAVDHLGKQVFCAGFSSQGCLASILIPGAVTRPTLRASQVLLNPPLLPEGLLHIWHWSSEKDWRRRTMTITEIPSRKSCTYDHGHIQFVSRSRKQSKHLLRGFMKQVLVWVQNTRFLESWMKLRGRAPAAPGQ